MSKETLTEDRICTILREQFHLMACNESQFEYEPLQLKWILPINTAQGIMSVLKNTVFVLGYVQKNQCNEDAIDKIIENDIRPMVNKLKDELDFFIAGTIMAICSTVDDFSDSDKLMDLVQEIIGKFIYMLELATKQLGSVSGNASEDSFTYEVNTSKLVIGMVIKNYKELCNLFGEDTKTGKAKQLQLKNWKRYFDWEKDGQKFIITDIYDTPLPKEDLRKKGNNSSHQPPVQLGVWNRPYKGLYLHARRAGAASICYLLPLKSGSILFLRLVILLLNVPFYYIFRYIPYCSNIVPTSPECLIPLVLQFWMPVINHQGAFPFQVPHEI